MSRISIPQPPTSPEGGQILSYLYQLAELLNVALNNLTEDQFSEAAIQSLTRTGNTTQREARDAYAQLRSLILTTADAIRTEMETLETSLHGIYVAQSDFGTYSEETNSLISANAEAITQQYNRITTIVSEIEGFDNYIQETEAYIKSGLLDDTVTPPVYGVEIGQRNDQDEAPNMVRITASRIGFYQNGQEACYISNGRWGAPGIDVGNDITIRQAWEVGVDAQEYFYIRYVGGNA